MQINYCNTNFRRATAEFWYPPSIDNTLRAMDVPPIYAPYGTPEFWPNGTIRQTMVQQTTPDTAFLGQNSAQGTTVASAVAMQGFGDPGSPAASPAIAAATGQSMGPATLVAPMPSITPSPQPALPAPLPPVPCNAVSEWVSGNPMLAALAVLGTYLMLGGHK